MSIRRSGRCRCLMSRAFCICRVARLHLADVSILIAQNWQPSTRHVFGSVLKCRCRSVCHRGSKDEFAETAAGDCTLRARSSRGVGREMRRGFHDAAWTIEALHVVYSCALVTGAVSGCSGRRFSYRLLRRRIPRRGSVGACRKRADHIPACPRRSCTPHPRRNSKRSSVSAQAPSSSIAMSAATTARKRLLAR